MTGEEHDNRRRLWNRGMSHESLVEYESVIVKRAAQLVNRLKEESRKEEKAVDIVQWINFFTFDFMGDMVFGGGFEFMRDGKDNEGIWTLMENAME